MILNGLSTSPGIQHMSQQQLCQLKIQKLLLKQLRSLQILQIKQSLNMLFYQIKENSLRNQEMYKKFVQQQFIGSFKLQNLLNSKMGPRNSKQTQLNFMKDYKVIQSNLAQNITYLQHYKTQDEYLLKQFNFNDKKESQKMMEKLAELKNKLAGSKHVVPLKDYLMNSQDQYCSTFYKIFALFQYPQRTLDDEINQRKLQRKKFNQTQLWSILASCIVGLSHLQKNGIKHSALKSNNILISREGIIKVADPFSIGQSPNYDSALTKRLTQHIYLSPQQTQAIQQQIASPTFNTFKSDIWTLGMIMLEAGLLQYQDEECYRDDKSRIHWQTVQYNIDRLGQAYSDEIRNMVEFMLSKDERARPDWIDLEEHVMKGGDQVRRSFIEEQNRGESDKISNPSQIYSNRALGLNSHRSKQNPQSQASNLLTNQINQINQTNVTPKPNSVINYQLPIHQPLQNQPPLHQGVSNFNNNFTRYSQRPESSRITNQNPMSFTYQPPPPENPDIYFLQGNPRVLQTSTPQFHQSITSQNSVSPVIPYSFGSTVPITQPPINIAPLKPSTIDQSRPSRNIFPLDSYVSKTKFDENLIVMTQDQQQNEQNFRQPQTTSYFAINASNFQVRQATNSNPQNINTNNQFQNRNFNSESSHQNRNIHMPVSSSIHGEPKFVTQQFRMGSKYQGYKLNGLRHGYGRFYYQDGGMYDGNWKQNKMSGTGKLYYQSGKLAYQGEWKNDQFMGKGILYNEVPDILQGDFDCSNFDEVDEFWTKYQGQFSDDLKNGKGVLYLSNGQKFDGHFVSDCVQGPGTFYCRNGNKINGNWNNNRKVG